jgi:hypothetical protein
MANGGVAGRDIRIIFKTGRVVDIRGIDNHQGTNIDSGTVGGVIQTQKGPVIGIMHQYALLNKASTIHSLCHFEWNKNDVNENSVNNPGGLQCIQTLDGYIIPLSIKVSRVCPSVHTQTMNGTTYDMSSLHLKLDGIHLS